MMLEQKKTMSLHKIRLACWPFLIIVRGRMLVQRANAKKVFLTILPPRWLALYGYLQNRLIKLIMTSFSPFLDVHTLVFP
jgi:hypothetical protein